MREKKFLIFLIFLRAASTDANKYPCEIDYNGKSCKISGLSLTRENYVIEPDAANLSDVQYFFLKNSSVPILSKGICDSMPNLKRFSARGSFEEIEEGAFSGCTKLTQIYLTDNNFVKLERNTFKGLTKLKELLVQGGNVPILDLDLTDLKQLKHLKLVCLNVTSFPVDMLHEQNSLEKLFLYSNNLFDLEVKKMLRLTPNLKEIQIADNNFQCNRLVTEIIPFLKENRVKIGAFYETNYLRKRDYTPEEMYNIHCLSGEQWGSEVSKFDFLLEKMPETTTEAQVSKESEVPKEPVAIIKTCQILEDADDDDNEGTFCLARKMNELEKNMKGLVEAKNDEIQKRLTNVSDGVENKLEELQQNLKRLTKMLNKKFEKLSQLIKKQAKEVAEKVWLVSDEDEDE